MTYTDAPLVAAYLKRELTKEEEVSLSVIIPAVQDYIDRKTGTTFLKVEPTTRYYDGGEGSLDIDPATDVSAVQYIDDDGVANYDYVLNSEYLTYPSNENVKTEISRRGGCFPDGDARIAVTARFSSYDDGVPFAIVNVATMLVGDFMKMKASNDAGNVKSESLEGHSVTYTDLSSTTLDRMATGNPLVQSVLQQYTDIMLG